MTVFSIASASNWTAQWKWTGLSADCDAVVKSRRPVHRARDTWLAAHSMRCTAAPLNSFQLGQKQEATVASCPDKDKQTQEGSVARPVLKALAWIRQAVDEIEETKDGKKGPPFTDETCLFYCSSIELCSNCRPQVVMRFNWRFKNSDWLIIDRERVQSPSMNFFLFTVFLNNTSTFTIKAFLLWTHKTNIVFYLCTRLV